MGKHVERSCQKMKPLVLLLGLVSCAFGKSWRMDDGLSVTTVNQRHVKSGELIFEDNFDTLNFTTWQHERTLSGGGNWEFQVYDNTRTNSYVKEGVLHLMPTLLEDRYGPGFVTSGTLNMDGGSPADECTNRAFFGCERIGSPANGLNPTMSARIRTVNSFSFRYGRVSVRAKMPAGDWLWPAIWMLPRHNAYGTWPASGEIDIVESRQLASDAQRSQHRLRAGRLDAALGPLLAVQRLREDDLVAQRRPRLQRRLPRLRSRVDAGLFGFLFGRN